MPEEPPLLLVGGGVEIWTAVAVSPWNDWKGVRDGSTLRVGVGVGVGVPLLGVGVGVVLGVDVGVEVGVEVGVGVGVGLGVGVGVGLGVGVGVGLGVGVGVGLGVGVGVGVGVAQLVGRTAELLLYVLESAQLSVQWKPVARITTEVTVDPTLNEPE